LTGGSDKNYIKFFVHAAQKQGYRCVVYHNRGVNKTKLLTPAPYDGVKLDDVEEAVNYIKSKYSSAPIFAVGMSFGGN
jgi:abhydrolase domain-containing protein 1/3